MSATKTRPVGRPRKPKSIMVGLRLPEPIADTLRIDSAIQRVPMQSIVADLLDAHYKRNPIPLPNRA